MTAAGKPLQPQKTMYKTNVVRNDVPVHTHTHTHTRTHTHTHTHTRERERTYKQEEMMGRTPANGLAAFTDRQKKKGKNVAMLLGDFLVFLCGRNPPQDPHPHKAL